jgi:AraC-like DNA-binding protein
MIEIFQNIREIYDFTQPDNELSPYIEFFSESSKQKCDLHFDKGHSSVKMFASWTPTFYINLSGPYLIDIGSDRYYVKAGEDIAILRNGIVMRHNQAADSIFTVKFYPGGLEAVLGLNQNMLSNKMVYLNQILPPTLLSRLRNPLTFVERVTILESYFLAALHKHQPRDHYLQMVSDAIGEYHAGNMQLNTSQIAERLLISSKTINRYFQRSVGIPPKRYFSVLRARTALTAMVADKADFNPYHYGYYDPAHFYKDVRNFTGRNLSLQL